MRHNQMLYDVELIGPSGYPETHFAVKADNEFEAARLSPIMLTANSHILPEQYTVISVKPSIYRESSDGIHQN